MSRPLLIAAGVFAALNLGAFALTHGADLLLLTNVLVLILVIGFLGPTERPA